MFGRLSFVLVLLCFVEGFYGFHPVRGRFISPTQPKMSGLRNFQMTSVADLADLAFSGIREPLHQQLDLVIPVIQSWNLPQPIIQWGHGAAMGTVLFAVLGTSLFLGLQVKKGRGNNKFWFTLGKTAREMHPLLALFAFVNFYIGSIGGLSSMASQGKPILESPHAITATAAMALMALQIFTPLAIPSGGKIARKAHSALGMMLFTLLLVNAYFGFNLGLSLSPSA